MEQISVDKTNHSVSFNEFLTFNGNVKTTTNPSDLLLECFEMFDIEKTGKIQETVFKRILTRKGGKQVKELDDMLDSLFIYFYFFQFNFIFIAFIIT